NRQFNISTFAITSPAGATDNTMNVSQTVNVHLAFNVTGGNWSNVGAALTVPAGWTKSSDLTGLSISNTANRTFDWTVTPSATPTSAHIAGGANQTYTYTCTPTGDGTLTFTGSAGGTDENTSAAVSTGNSTSNSITVDSIVPLPPSTPDMTDASDSGSSNTDNITNVKKPSFTGTETENGTTVTLLVDGVANGTFVTSGGTWTITAANNIA